MATLSLNIYKSKNEIEKTYTAESYDLMLGTIEEFMQIIDIDKMGDKTAVASMVFKCYGQLKPLIKDIFPDVTDDELKRVKLKELIPLFINVGTATIESMDVLAKQGN